MIKSMTGFGRSERTIAVFGAVTVELRSTNHKFLEIVLHLPEGFLFIEDKIKKEIEGKIKRGRVVCAVTLAGGTTSSVAVNKKLLAQYVRALAGVKREFALADSLSINTLIHLPGVLTVTDHPAAKEAFWPQLKPLVQQAVHHLTAVRQREGKALHGYVASKVTRLSSNINVVKARFHAAIKLKTASFVTDDERVSFLKNADITEELERLQYHCRNLVSKLRSSHAVGKEMDFIAQEMQREANTMGAKSCDTRISAYAVEIKSLIEKIREQVQNIE